MLDPLGISRPGLAHCHRLLQQALPCLFLSEISAWFLCGIHMKLFRLVWEAGPVSQVESYHLV